MVNRKGMFANGKMVGDRIATLVPTDPVGNRPHHIIPATPGLFCPCPVPIDVCGIIRLRPRIFFDFNDREYETNMDTRKSRRQTTWPLRQCVAIVSIVAGIGLAAPISADEPQLDSFRTLSLTDVYYSEGVNLGDLNGDGVADIVYGPYWFEGPKYRVKHEIYAPVAQPRQAYADHFFSWIRDFDGDGWNDILVVGFPGKPAHVYQNPGNLSRDGHWPRHEVLDWVSNESPQFTQLVGDDRPELVCTRDGRFGYATIEEGRPWGPWTFHPLSKSVAPKQFGHGLGVGDVNGDGRPDVIAKNGWFEQPDSLDDDPLWLFHPYEFTRAGGADMHAVDVDGDGDNDIITSLAAHEFGLAWFEQIRDGGEITFLKHPIMGREPEENRYGIVFSELHTVGLADIDGDGLKDIVTGKTFWSHHTKSPMWDAGAVVYWFRCVRHDDGVDWVPYQAASDTGVGRQVIVGDADGDGLPDIVVGGMKGAHLLLHERRRVDEVTWQAAQPRPLVPMQSGLTPEEAARNMTVLDGFKVRLAAGEPQIHQPIGFTIDPRGRLWVAEAYTYPIRAEEGQGRDKIVILEDTDGDGTLDSRKVFAEGLNLVSGLEVGFGGVWVGAAPYLMFIPDRNGDDVPDGDPEILLDGFGYQDTHETLNSFIWGPDGWLYGCHGVFTHSRVGKPGTPDDQRTPLNAGVWRYHPTRHQFEVFAWGTSNPWGVDFDDRGQAFITACVIPHLWHVIQGARYQRQGGRHFNPYLYDDIQTIADHSHFVGDIREHAWWGHEPNAPTDTLMAGGGHAHCGAMIYLADNWPAAYRNQIFMNNIHGNRVNMDLLEPAGSGFVGHHGPDLLIAGDRWFRGINLKYGPDGTVYLIDWYDKNACHRTNPEIWDRTNGRIYNIAYGNPSEVSVDLEELSDADLVRMQAHANDWYVRTARRILQDRAARGKLAAETVDQLTTWFEDAQTVPQMLRALWALHVIDGLDASFRLELLQHPDETIRGWAIQLEWEDREASPEFLQRMVALARSDPSPIVRKYLASAAMRMESPADRWPLVEALAAHSEDATDHNLPLLYWYAIEPLVTSDVDGALDLAQRIEFPLLTRLIYRRAAAAPQSLAAVVDRLAATAEVSRQEQILDEMLKAFEGRVHSKIPASWEKAYDVLADSPSQAVRDRADQVAVVFGDRRVYPRFRSLLANPAADIERRREALKILVRGRDKQAGAAFQAALKEPALRGEAIRALSSLDDARTPTLLIGMYDRLKEGEKRDAIATLCARPDYAIALLDAVATGRIPSQDVHAYEIRQLLQFGDSRLKSRIAEVWGEVRETSESTRAAIARYKQMLNPKQLAQANLGNGRRLFDTTCASCHRLFGQGGKVGPDITGSNRADLDYILENILDPSAVLGKDYRMTVLALADGRLVSGLVLDESDSAVTVRTINDTLVIGKDDIEQRRLSDLSLMPEGQLDRMKPEEVRDLIAYLASPVQVAPRGPAAPIDAETGRVPDAIEGEAMKIVGKTAGNAGSQRMEAFAADRWSGNDHLWWTGAKPGDRLDLEFEVGKDGQYDLELVLTRARDYGVVQLALDDKPLGEPIDLFNSPEVVTTGLLRFPVGNLTAGRHVLHIEIVGTHPQAIPSYMFGLDFIRLMPAKTVEQ